MGENALKLRLSEQYIEALQEVLTHSQVVMVPKSGEQGSVASPKSIAQILSVYKQVMGSS